MTEMEIVSKLMESGYNTIHQSNQSELKSRITTIFTSSKLYSGTFEKSKRIESNGKEVTVWMLKKEMDTNSNDGSPPLLQVEQEQKEEKKEGPSSSDMTMKPEIKVKSESPNVEHRGETEVEEKKGPGRPRKISDREMKRLHNYDDKPRERIKCIICKHSSESAKIVICTKCNKGSHIYCLQPPLVERPEEWLCEDCKPVGKVKKEESVRLKLGVKNNGSQSVDFHIMEATSADKDEASTKKKRKRK